MGKVFRPLAYAAVVFLAISGGISSPPIERALEQRHLHRNIDASVTVHVGNAMGHFGSGTVIRTRSGRSYVLTAAHVVRHCRYVDKDGKIQFNPLTVSQHQFEKGLITGNVVSKATIVRYSSGTGGYDIAFLRLDDETQLTTGARFNRAIHSLSRGTAVYNVGTPLQQEYLRGIVLFGSIARTGLQAVGNYPMDTLDATVFPGCSGSGLFLRSNGQYIGMVVRAIASETMPIYVPIHHIRDFATRAQLGFLIDSSQQEPTDALLASFPVDQSDRPEPPPGTNATIQMLLDIFPRR